MDSALQIVLLSYPLGLIFFFLLNIFYFIFSKQTEADKIFEYKILNYKYQDVKKRLEKLQVFLGKDIAYAFEKLEKYNSNVIRTRRKFRVHQEAIERSMVLIYAKKDEEAPVKYLYKNLSILLKIEIFFTMLFFPVLLVLFMFFIPIDLIIIKIILLIFWIVIVYSFWFMITKMIITLKYEFLDILIRLFKRPSGKLRRNLNCLEYLYHTSYFHRPLKWLLYGGVLSLLGVKTKAGFKFWGGKFGGGGAGGSW